MPGIGIALTKRILLAEFSERPVCWSQEEFLDIFWRLSVMMLAS